MNGHWCAELMLCWFSFPISSLSITSFSWRGDFEWFLLWRWWLVFDSFDSESDFVFQFHFQIEIHSRVINVLPNPTLFIFVVLTWAKEEYVSECESVIEKKDRGRNHEEEGVLCYQQVLTLEVEVDFQE